VKSLTIDRLDPSMVDDKVDRHARELMYRFYPEPIGARPPLG
jgi:hypothetical protein